MLPDVYAENLTDNDSAIPNVGASLLNPVVSLPPRTVGLRLQYAFFDRDEFLKAGGGRASPSRVVIPPTQVLFSLQPICGLVVH